MNIPDELTYKFRSGDVVTRLLFINGGMYILMLLIGIVFTIITGSDDALKSAFRYPGDVQTLIHHPWTVITAMFSSWGMWHLIFNLIILYWLGKVFLKYYTSNSLRGLYIIGSLTAMAVFSAVFSLFPSIREKDWTAEMPMASASILAFATALAFKAPDNTEPIPFLGNVKLKYIVIALALTDIALLPWVNPATDAAHLGSVLAGWVFYRLMRKGIDITAPVSRIYVLFSNLFSKKVK